MVKFEKKIFGKQFEIDSHAIDLVFHSVFRATDVTTGKSVAIVVSLSPLKNDPSVQDSYIERMNLVATLNHQLYPVIKFGIDSNLHCFSVIKALDGINIFTKVRDFAEAERRFVLILKALLFFYRNGVAFGDLSDGSFMLERSGNIRFICGVGDISNLLQDSSTYNKKIASIYIHPNQDPFKRDVYSLGVIASKLFTGEYPQPELKLEHLRFPPPSWFLGLVPKMLELQLTSVEQVAEEYEKLKTSVTALQKVNDIKAPKIQAAQQTVVTIGPQLATSSGTITKKIRHPSISKPIVFIGVGIGVFLISLIVLYILSSLKGPVIQVASQSHKDQGIDLQTLKSLSNSDDPVSLKTLVSLLEDASNLQEYQQIHQAILLRAIRQGMSISAELVRRWALKFFDQGQKLPISQIYAVFDVILPVESFLEILNNLKSLDETAAKLLAVGYCLDRKDDNFTKIVISEFFKKDLSIQELVISDSDLLMEFGDLAIKYTDIPTEKLFLIHHNLISWGFDQKAQQVKEELEERELNYKQKIILKLLDNPLPTQAKLFLSRVLINQQSLDLLTGWRDPLLVDFALASSLFFNDSSSLEIIWSLINQAPIQDPLLMEAIQLVKSKYSNQKHEFIELLSLIRFNEHIPPIEGIAVLKKFIPQIKKDKNFINLIFNLKNPELITLAFNHFKDYLSIDMLLMFLTHPVPDIKAMAIVSLKNVKDIGALKLIINNYEKEKDPKIRQLYEANFWVIQERINKQN